MANVKCHPQSGPETWTLSFGNSRELDQSESATAAQGWLCSMKCEQQISQPVSSLGSLQGMLVKAGLLMHKLQFVIVFSIDQASSYGAYALCIEISWASQ